MRHAGLAALFAAVYWGTGQLSRLIEGGGGPTAIWPPTGLLLAGMLIAGCGAFPGPLIGAAIGAMLHTQSPAAGLALAGGNVAAACLTGHLLRRLPPHWTFYTPQGILALGFIAALAAVVSATASLAYRPGWLAWWGGNVVSVLVLTPAALYWARHPRFRLGAQAFEGALLGAFSAALLFTVVFGNPRNLSTSYLAFPPLVWAALRFGLRETATIIVLVAAAAAWGTARGLGPYPGHPLLAQAFIGVAAVLAQLLAAAIWQTKDAARELQERELHLRVAAEAARIGTYRWAPGREFAVWDQKCRDMFGFTGGEEVALADIRRRVHPDDQTRFDELIARAADPAGTGEYENEYRIILPDGSTRWISSRARMQFEAGRPIVMTGVAADITERRLAGEELERRVRERTTDLAAANRELESFTHSLSHDMRASLRKIAVFGELIVKDPETRLSDESKRRFERIEAAVLKMHSILEGLLRLSTINRAPLKREPLDLSAMAQEAGAAMATRYPACPVEFVVEPGLKARG